MPSNQLGPYTPPQRRPVSRRTYYNEVLENIRDRVQNERERVQAINRADLLRRYREQQSRLGGVAMPITAGATNVIQRAVVKQRSGKRVRRKSVNYLYRLQKAVTSTAILRWQGMTEYDSNGFHRIGYVKATVANDFGYPVYIFDVTSCSMMAPSSPGTVVRMVGTPMYRLESNSAGNFYWSVQQGVGPDGVASPDWFTETARGQNAITTDPNFGQNSMLAWSDIRLALYGATNQTTRFNVSFIQFTDEVFHPRGVREAPAVPVVVQPGTNDQTGRFNAAMEELVKPLVYHPMHSAGNAQNVYRVLESRSFSVQPNSETNEAKASPNVCYKLFKRMNRICKWVWQTSDNQATTTSTEVKIDPLTGMDNGPNYNQFFGGTKKPYVHPNARVYMMITAQAYTRADVSITPAPIPYSSANTPTFDVQVRNKWLYDSS